MFGNAVRTYRQRLGITQAELADRAGVSVRHVQNLEAGRISRPRQSTVRLLADAFDLGRAARDRFWAAARADAAHRGDPAGPGWPRPAQLPPDLPDVVGRAEELDRLTALVRGGSPTTVVTGTAGVGKTALAVRWAHQVRDRFPDGQLYADLRGFHPTGTVLAPAEAIRGFLDALDVPPPRIPEILDARVGLYRSLLAGRRVLVVLDNARGADHVRPLLPGSPTCVVVVTSRDQLTGLVAEGAQALTLDLLDRSAAREMLARRLGAQRIAAEPAAVDEIVTRCARLPLALAIAAARAATQPDFPLSVLAGELAADRGRLAALTGAEPASDLRTVFSRSYRTLSPAAARLFRRLGPHRGPDLSAAAAARLAGLSPRRARPLLAELTRTNLFAELAPGRYTVHGLLRAYAQELANDAGPVG